MVCLSVFDLLHHNVCPQFSTARKPNHNAHARATTKTKEYDSEGSHDGYSRYRTHSKLITIGCDNDHHQSHTGFCGTRASVTWHIQFFFLLVIMSSIPISTLDPYCLLLSHAIFQRRIGTTLCQGSQTQVQESIRPVQSQLFLVVVVVVSVCPQPCHLLSHSQKWWFHHGPNALSKLSTGRFVLFRSRIQTGTERLYESDVYHLARGIGWSTTTTLQGWRYSC